MRRWAKEDPAAMWEWVQKNVYPKLSPGRKASKYDLFTNWIRLDVEAAAAAAAESPDSWLHGSLHRDVLEILLGDDEPLSARVIENLDELIPGSVWPHRDRGGAKPDGQVLETIQALPESGAKERLRRQLTKDWYGSDWRSAAEWVAELPPGDREVAGRAILESGLPQSEKALSEVANWLAGEGAPAGMLGVHSRELIKKWAKSDPESAGRWVARHHVGATRLLLEADLRAANQE